eukprot:SAG31_NODE_4679_length_3035_cov_1.736824_1_plen_420_part_00
MSSAVELAPKAAVSYQRADAHASIQKRAVCTHEDFQARKHVLENSALVTEIIGSHLLQDGKRSKPLWRLGAVSKTFYEAQLDLPRLVVFRGSRPSAPFPQELSVHHRPAEETAQVRWARKRLQDSWDIYCDGDDGVIKLAQVLSMGTENWITKLHLVHSGITDAGAQMIADTLQHNHSVTLLDFAHNQIACAGAKALAHALRINTVITTVDLRDNKICAEGASSIAAALRKNQTLQSLSLRSNAIGPLGGSALATALGLPSHSNSICGTSEIHESANHHLKCLDVSDNQILDQGGQDLGSMLQCNCSLESLHLGSNLLTDISAQAIGASLRINGHLVELGLIGSSFSHAGISALADGLVGNRCLQSLSLKWNSICQSGARSLVAMLRANRTLLRIDLCGCNLGWSTAYAWGFSDRRILL